MQARVLFYGDDFTGASDNAAQYARHGLPTLLFFSDPGEAALRAAAQTHAVVGVAGTARSLGREAMRDELVPVLEKFRQLGVPLVQYKCCSTFDSSPATGSLGQAIQLMRSCWPDSLVPVLAATPEFGRYTLFGHHFARAGQAVYRLDRHPVMSRHPVTPMHESSLSKVLTDQGFSPAQEIDLRQLDSVAETPAKLADDLLALGSAVFDGYTQTHVMTAAAAIWHASRERQVCAMAAQGFAHALGAWLRQTGQLSATMPAHRLGAVDRLLVLSGSCSALSGEQIAWARQAGFVTLRIDPGVVARGEDGAINELISRTLAALSAGSSVVVFTAEGPHDVHGSVSGAMLAHRIGKLFARLAREAVAVTGLKRLVVSGGDSSSFTMREIGAQALQIKASHFEQNAHVCTLVSDDPLIHGKEVLLKGGQVGQANLYGLMRKGFDNSAD